MTMPAPVLPSALPDAVRLALARTLAWALLVGGWLVLGEAGQRHLPLLAGGMVPLALWLAGLGAQLALLRGRRVSMVALRASVLAAGAGLAGAGLVPGRVGQVLAAALAWSLLLVAASLTVQALRRTMPSRPPAPLVPATAGALLAWLAASQVELPVGPAAAMAMAALGVFLLVPRGAAPVPACRAGLFDCSLPWPNPSGWRRAADWPQQAALLAMLPMMTSLPAMAGWCRTGLGLSPATGVLWHLAAMLLPALLLRGWLARTGARAQRGAVAALLIASGGALWVLPGLTGLMAAGWLQAAAWSLAWAGPMLSPPLAAARTDRSPPPGAIRRTLGSAGAVLALGTFTAAVGPDALRTTQALLAALALAGAAGGVVAWSASLRPAQRHP